MNKPTKEERGKIVQGLRNIIEVYGNHIGSQLAGVVRDAIALILASPEAGEQRGDVVKVTYTSECPRCGWATERTDILSLDDGYALSAEEVALLRKADPMIEADEQLADSTRPAPLHAEVEAAMDTLHDLVKMADDCYAATEDKHYDALSTIRAALTEARQPKVVSREGKRIPHKCPVCDGSGQTMQRFDSPGTADYPTARPCIACGGTGIVWSEELGLTVEEPK